MRSPRRRALSSKELLAALKAAGIEAKAAASSVEEADALKAIAAAKGDGGATATKSRPESRGDAEAEADAQGARPRRRTPAAQKKAGQTGAAEDRGRAASGDRRNAAS